MTSWEWSDAWVLLASLRSQSSDGALLDEVIACADGLNHAILLLDEINHAVARLGKIGFVSIDGERLLVTDAGQAFCKRHAKGSAVRCIDGLHSVLQASWPLAVGADSPQLLFTAAEYEAACERYRRRTSR
jgi:hypothetical protein